MPPFRRSCQLSAPALSGSRSANEAIGVHDDGVQRVLAGIRPLAEVALPGDGAVAFLRRRPRRHEGFHRFVCRLALTRGPAAFAGLFHLDEAHVRLVAMPPVRLIHELVDMGGLYRVGALQIPQLRHRPRQTLSLRILAVVAAARVVELRDPDGPAEI